MSAIERFLHRNGTRVVLPHCCPLCGLYLEWTITTQPEDQLCTRHARLSCVCGWSLEMKETRP